MIAPNKPLIPKTMRQPDLEKIHLPLTALSAVVFFTAFAPSSVLAADRTWVGGYVTTGTWNQATQWSEGAYANGSDVIFNNTTGVSTASTFLSASRTVKSITFNGGTPSPAFNIRLATSNGGGTAANLTFIPTNTGITVAAANTASHNIGQSDGSIVLQANLLVTHNGSGTLTLSRPVTGTGFSLTKAGSGLLVLSALNTHSGDTIINSGKLSATVGGSSANSEVVINNAAATFATHITNNSLSWTCNAFTPAAAGTLEFNFGAVLPSTTVAPLVVTNAADFTTATPTVNILVNSPGLIPGTYPLMTWGSISGPAPTTAGLTVSNVAAGTVPSLSITGNTLNLVISSTSASIVKADNTDNLNLGSSWVGGVAPSTVDVAKWNNIVTTANTTVLGADTTWAGISIENPAGQVTINGTNTLTLGAAPVDVDMNAATANLAVNCPLALGGDNVWNVADTRSLTLAGKVSGAFGFTKLGAGTTLLSSSANDYTGNTTVTAGTLRLGASNVIPHGAGGVAGNVVVNGSLDLNGRSDSINGLSGSGILDNTAAAASTLAVGNNSQTTTFSGIIQSTTGNINLIKTGNGTLTLTGANTFTGAVTINASTGILALGNTAPLNNVTSITIGGGSSLRPTVANAVVNAPINLGTVGTISTINAPNAALGGTTGVPFTLGGVISGAGDLTLSGIESTNAYGIIILNAASDYTGATLFTTASTTNNNNANLFVRLGVANALPATTVLTLDGGDGTGGGRFCELNLFGNDQTLAGLTNVSGRTLRNQEVSNSSSTAATLTLNNTADFTFSGRIGGGATENNLGLTKSGAGIFTISGANTYIGATTITGGTLALGALNTLPNTSPVSIGAGTLQAASAGTESASTLQVTGAATINLGTNAVLAFADSSAVTWIGNLNLTGTFVSGTSLRFGDGTGTGLTPAQLASISATGFTGFALDGSGFLTATPGGGGFASWITGSFAGGTIPVDKRGANDDFDNDGISNLVEYAVDAQDPTVPDSSIGTYSANTLSFTKRAGTSGLTYAIQDSTDLGITDAWAEVSGGSYVNDSTTISFTLTPGTPAKNFLRLQVVTN